MTEIKITICDEYKAAEHLVTRPADFTHVLSIRSPGDRDIDGFSDFPAGRKCRVTFDDVTHNPDLMEKAGYLPPNRDHAQDILDFAKSIKEPAHVLVHCHAGISRSSAAAYILLCAIRGPGSEEQSMVDVYNAREVAMPNSLLVRCGSDLLHETHGHRVFQVYETLARRRWATNPYRRI